MASWTYVNYVIEGPAEILQKIKEAIIKHPITKDSAFNWEGNTLTALDIEFDEVNPETKRPKYFIRGFITKDTEWLDEETGTLKFSAEESGGVTDLDVLLKLKFPDINVYWYAEEYDTCYYTTNDVEGKYFKDRYYVDACVEGDFIDEYFVTEEDAYNKISSLVGKKISTESDIEDFNSEANIKEQEDYINMYSINVLK